ncbi:type II toxin-antitoxin system RelE/ParE family toxin [Ensifer soli]|uniref:type II toxin-antitoxin system RelE/ParE family toxin n=1 Tax=Ciceribacter sp. sgz301302 TaxID=3342379 RepID=UPI0035BB527E
MKVVITDEAEADLEHIGDYIAIDNPVRAETFVAELVERCLTLGHMPRMFPLLAGYAHTGIRRRPHGEYLIFYRIAAETIDVLHVLNGAQDYEAILFADE